MSTVPTHINGEPWDDYVARRTREERAAQGLPPTVEDPAVLAKIRTLLIQPAPPTAAPARREPSRRGRGRDGQSAVR